MCGYSIFRKNARQKELYSLQGVNQIELNELFFLPAGYVYVEHKLKINGLQKK